MYVFFHLYKVQLLLRHLVKVSVLISLRCSLCQDKKRLICQKSNRHVLFLYASILSLKTSIIMGPTFYKYTIPNTFEFAILTQWVNNKKNHNKKLLVNAMFTAPYNDNTMTKMTGIIRKRSCPMLQLTFITLVFTFLNINIRRSWSFLITAPHFHKYVYQPSQWL